LPKGLQSLDLRENMIRESKITDNGLKHLKKLSALQSLYLSWCKMITDNGLEHLKALSALQYLDLTWCNKITDNGLEHFKALFLLLF
jgi:hypothetical protein